MLICAKGAYIKDIFIGATYTGYIYSKSVCIRDTEISIVFVKVANNSSASIIEYRKINLQFVQIL